MVLTLNYRIVINRGRMTPEILDLDKYIRGLPNFYEITSKSLLFRYFGRVSSCSLGNGLDCSTRYSLWAKVALILQTFFSHNLII